MINPGRLDFANTAGLILLFSLVAAMAAASENDSGQEVTTDAEAVNTPTSEDTQPTPRDHIMALIANEVVIAPGVGLSNVRLGTPLTDLTSRLGPPEAVDQEGILRRKSILRYRLDSDVVIMVEGRRVVERMVVVGGPVSLIRTSQGARFGMKKSMIRRIYRNPGKAGRDYIRYRRLGVDFIFANDQLTRIEVYPRKR